MHPQATRQECYAVSRNQCRAEAEDQAASGVIPECNGWNQGSGDCDSNDFQSRWGPKADEVCNTVAENISSELP